MVKKKKGNRKERENIDISDYGPREPGAIWYHRSEQKS